MEAEIQALKARMTRLERSAARSRTVAAIALSALVVILLGAAAAEPGSIKASRIAVVDKQGRERIVLTSTPDEPDGAILALLDSAGKAHLMLTANDSGYAAMTLRDIKTRKIHLQAAVVDPAEPSLEFFDAAGNPRLSSGVNEDGPYLRLKDERQKQLFHAP